MGRIITLQGEVFHPQGSITGGSLSEGNKDMINRQKRLEEENEILVELEKELKTLLDQYQSAKASIDEKNKKMEELLKEEDVIQSEKDKLDRKLDQM